MYFIIVVGFDLVSNSLGGRSQSKTERMRAFLLLTMFGCINCEERNITEFLPSDNFFRVIWEMPSGLCDKFATLDATGTVQDYGFQLDSFNILNNPRDLFYGETNTIFYNFGQFPLYALGDESQEQNGGTPLAGNFTDHLLNAMDDIRKEIPNPDFAGIAVINQEEWRPTWNMNFGWKSIYQDKSIAYMEKLHPNWSEDKILDETIAAFEESTRNYTEQSLNLGKALRPNGLWGYYAYPYCYNYKIPTQSACRDAVKADNDQMWWFWDSASVILPSIYFFVEYSPEDLGNFLYSQIEEAVRVGQKNESRKYTPVYAYVKAKYNMSLPVFFYKPIHMFASIRMPADFGLEGIILWGSDPEFNDPAHCDEMKHYTLTVMGPYVKKVTDWAQKCAKQKCNSNGRCIHRGAQDRKFMSEIMRPTLDDLNDFSITYKQLCKCLDGYGGTSCEKTCPSGFTGLNCDKRL